MSSVDYNHFKKKDLLLKLFIGIATKHRAVADSVIQWVDNVVVYVVPLFCWPPFSRRSALCVLLEENMPVINRKSFSSKLYTRTSYFGLFKFSYRQMWFGTATKHWGRADSLTHKLPQRILEFVIFITTVSVKAIFSF